MGSGVPFRSPFSDGSLLATELPPLLGVTRASGDNEDCCCCCRATFAALDDDDFEDFEPPATDTGGEADDLLAGLEGCGLSDGTGLAPLLLELRWRSSTTTGARALERPRAVGSPMLTGDPAFRSAVVVGSTLIGGELWTSCAFFRMLRPGILIGDECVAVGVCVGVAVAVDVVVDVELPGGDVARRALMIASRASPGGGDDGSGVVAFGFVESLRVVLTFRPVAGSEYDCARDDLA